MSTALSIVRLQAKSGNLRSRAFGAARSCIFQTEKRKLPQILGLSLAGSSGETASESEDIKVFFSGLANSGVESGVEGFEHLRAGVQSQGEGDLEWDWVVE